MPFQMLHCVQKGNKVEENLYYGQTYCLFFLPFLFPFSLHRFLHTFLQVLTYHRVDLNSATHGSISFVEHAFSKHHCPATV